MDSEEDVLDAEIMKAIRNSLKELNITSPSRPSRPPPGAVAHDEAPADYSDEDNCEEQESMVTKASDMERDLQESLKEVLVIKDDDKNESDLTDDDEVSEATLASCNVKAIADDRAEDDDEVSEATLASCNVKAIADDRAEDDQDDRTTVSSSTRLSQKKPKSAISKKQLKEAINASLADISLAQSSRPITPNIQETPNKWPSRGTSPTPPAVVPSIVSKANGLAKEQRKGMYRPVVIDGCCMGFAYANHDRFCAEGLRVTYECFKCLGYDDSDIVIIFKHIPQHYKTGRDQAIIDYYHQLGVLHYCPSRYAGDVLIKSNDDLFLLKTATELEGVVLSTDRFRDYWDLYPEYQTVIMNRLIQPTFIKDQLILPLDPLGDQGPELDQVLRFTE